MSLPPYVESAISRAIGQINFAPQTTTVVTPAQRVAQIETAMRTLAASIMNKGVAWSCPVCKEQEILHPAHEVPAHRHGNALVLLRRIS